MESWQSHLRQEMPAEDSLIKFMEHPVEPNAVLELMQNNCGENKEMDVDGDIFGEFWENDPPIIENKQDNKNKNYMGDQEKENNHNEKQEMSDGYLIVRDPNSVPVAENLDAEMAATAVYVVIRAAMEITGPNQYDEPTGGVLAVNENPIRMEQPHD